MFLAVRARTLPRLTFLVINVPQESLVCSAIICGFPCVNQFHVAAHVTNGGSSRKPRLDCAPRRTVPRSFGSVQGRFNVTATKYALTAYDRPSTGCRRNIVSAPGGRKDLL